MAECTYDARDGKLVVYVTEDRVEVLNMQGISIEDSHKIMNAINNAERLAREDGMLEARRIVEYVASSIRS